MEGRGSPIVPVLAGPTGSGKTALVCALDPSQFEVIACDSRQVYAQMPIGTASPTAAELAAIPHHVVGVVLPSEYMTAGRFRDLALAAIALVRSRGRTPLLVVGTGFYYSALKGSMFPQIDDEAAKTAIAQ